MENTNNINNEEVKPKRVYTNCLLYTSDAADE